MCAGEEIPFSSLQINFKHVTIGEIVSESKVYDRSPHTRHLLQMKIAEKSFREISNQFLKIAALPFIITMLCGLAGALSGGTISKIMISIINGQLAITLLKVCFYIGIIILSIAFIFRKTRMVHSPLHTLGEWVAGIGFITSATAAGVGAGLYGGIAVETSITLAIAPAVHLLFLFTSLCAVFWLAAAAPKLAQSESHKWEGTIFTCLAVLTAGISSAFLYCEQWTEIDGLALEQRGTICTCIYNYKPGT